ncbi:uncharacterized protein [Amphiura filiformis]|uniref:uncharacterized protein n=1 Tax=Amphiura filiformis TaxID=82378 RepID=UPI003B211722
MMTSCLNCFHQLTSCHQRRCQSMASKTPSSQQSLLAGITDDDAFFDDQPVVEPTLPTNANNNQSNSAISQASITSSQSVPNVSVSQQLFNIKNSQQQPATSFTTSSVATPVVAAPAPIQTLQPVSNVSPQVNTQPVHQQQPTITLPANNASGGSIQLALNPQQVAALQQGGRIIQSGNTIQIVPPQPQIVQAIQPNGTPIQLALLPSSVPLGQHILIRQPLKPGTKVGNQTIGGSPSRNPPNIQPKLTTASQVIKPPISIRPYQALAPHMPSVASSVAQPSIMLQPPAATGQTLQLTNLAQTQQTQTQASHNVLIQNQVSGVPVVTMGVSRGSIIVMTQTTRSSTTTSQQQPHTSTVNTSSTKPSLAPAPSPSTTPEVKPKPAPKKKKSKKKSKEKDKSKLQIPITTAVSVTQSVTTVTTSTAQQQTTPAVSYTQQTFVTSNGQAVVVQPPSKQVAGGAVPIVPQVNLAALPQVVAGNQQGAAGNQQSTAGNQQGAVVNQQSQQSAAQQVQQYKQVTMTTSSGQQIIANIPLPPNANQMTAEQLQQYLIQTIKLQQQQG